MIHCKVARYSNPLLTVVLRFDLVPEIIFVYGRGVSKNPPTYFYQNFFRPIFWGALIQGWWYVHARTSSLHNNIFYSFGLFFLLWSL